MFINRPHDSVHIEVITMLLVKTETFGNEAKIHSEGP